MADISDGKIWKYMDLVKFASMLTTRSLYFACPTTQFTDPYEGYLPKSHIEAELQLVQELVNPIIALKQQLAASGVAVEHIDDALKSLSDRTNHARREAASRFGVSCWHESEYESEAMWKLYTVSGQGIAIESSIGNLRKSLGNRTDLVIDRVRYMDFDKDPIEKGHKHYGLFIKRKSYEHEKEVRATVLLPEHGKGIAVACDLDILVTQFHVSPLLEGYVRDVIEALCRGTTKSLDKPVRQSPLYFEPDYGFRIKTE